MSVQSISFQRKVAAELGICPTSLVDTEWVSPSQSGGNLTSYDRANNDAISTANGWFRSSRGCPTEGFKKFTLLAEDSAGELQSAAAANNVGVYLLKGLGVDRDVERAVEWFQRAAEAGSRHAAENLRLVGEVFGMGPPDPNGGVS